MIANAESLEALHTHTHTHTICLEDKSIASFLCSKIKLIHSKIIDRVEFVYLFKLRRKIASFLKLLVNNWHIRNNKPLQFSLNR